MGERLLFFDFPDVALEVEEGGHEEGWQPVGPVEDRGSTWRSLPQEEQ